MCSIITVKNWLEKMIIEETVEDLNSELQEALMKIENIAAKVVEQKIDAYEGFMESEKYKDQVVKLGYKLKELGIDITTQTENI